MKRLFRMAMLLPFFAALPAMATVLAAVHGVVHDPQHRPVTNAHVTLQSADSAFVLKAPTDAYGRFDLPLAPIGVYRLSVAAPGFETVVEVITLASGTSPVLHIELPIASATETVVVEGDDDSTMATDSVTPTTLITRKMIEQTPGADRTLGMEMITDFVPGAYMTHDMLHMRGGHQTSWLLDGIEIPNTKIASNVGPQIDPKDIGQLETQRGSYEADIGDRTYGVFDVLPRNGFEYNRNGELYLLAGNLDSGESQLSFGNHSTKTAWYTSLTGSRSNYGLATPVAAIYHDATNSESGFVSIIRNQTPKDQLRFDAQIRHDFFQVPYDPSSTDYECASGYYCSYGLRDGQSEDDAFAILNWIHTLSSKVLFDAAPFYHLNIANYNSRPSDMPVATTWNQKSNYAGVQADVRATAGPNNLSAGLYSFSQAENDVFGVIDNADGTSYPNTPGHADAGLVEFYLTDHLRLGRYVTLLGGERFSFFRAELNESATYPRIGATLLIPHLNWVFRGFYGHFFQPAPIQTVSSSVLDYAHSLPAGENIFTPIPSERDEEHQFGVHIPYRGWLLDIDTFKNRVNNFLDHSNIGESNMYFPIAIDGALVRAWEMTLHSPQLSRLGRFYVTYSNQIAEQRGNIIGGFTCSISADPACNLGPDYTPVDHDQRQTLNTGFTAALPLRTWFAANVYYGSGFSNGLAHSGYGPYQNDYLPAHTTFDISAGHKLGQNWNFSGSIVNVANYRVLLDNSITIGGFHWNDPRTIYATLHYRFHY